jgi:diguanylate cyclase (GGDEF)-like protein
MNGIDEGWTQTSEWEARYATLPPGHYTFEVESGTWDHGWFGQPARMSVVVIGPWWRSRWFATGATLFGAALILLFWRYREREHQRLQRQLVIAVKERTDELQMERTRERDSNAILEMIVGNRPYGDVLDAIGDLICAHTGADMCCVLQRRGDLQTIVAAGNLPPAWKAALLNAGVIPFEVWRTSLISGAGTDPVWRPLVAALGEPAPRFIISRVIGNPGASLGLTLIFYTNAGLAPAMESFEAPARLARIAMEHARMYDNLHRQARHDSLTGLPNRLRLEECLEMAIRDCDAGNRKLALFFIDLDGFKEVNDTLSHRAGDLYLREIAERMKQSVRAGDIVGRIGGDEFNVIVPLIEGRGSAEEIAARVLDEVRRPVTIDGVEVSTTASLGIAIYPDDATEGDELRRKADAAMYGAKGAGKNRFEICGHQASHSGWRGTEYEIRSALAENRLRMDFQPKVTPAGRIASLEALVRLEHPLRGEIGPSEFIPVAERTGLILPVGLWVLNEVCRQIADWSQRGISAVPVAVNISSAQLCRDDFARSVEELLDAHHVDAAALEFEVTESLPVDKSDVAGRQMQSLRRLGVRFAIDDFGVGHSSFHWLREHSVDAIKLDRSLVQSIGTDGSIRKLVEAMIGVAGRMGIEVVAAGVETEEQKVLLVKAGCDLMQGYLFARPQPARMMESLLAGGEKVIGGEREQRGLLELKKAVELAGTT